MQVMDSQQIISSTRKNEILKYFLTKYDLEKAMELTSNFIYKQYDSITKEDLDYIHALLYK